MDDPSSSSTRFQNRRSMVDRENAVSGARNPGDSKYGNALFRGNGVQERLHSAELRRIEKQLKRSNMHIDQAKKQFVQRYATKEPMIIVVRPPSPEAIRKYRNRQYNEENEYEHGDPEFKGGKRYMQPLKRNVHNPNFRPGIDAFCLQTKKKVNVWEHAMLKRDPPKFRSTVMPSYPLSDSEVAELMRGMEYHKLELEASSKERIQKETRKKKKKKRITPALLPASPGHLEEETEESDTQWRFVTESAPLKSDTNVSFRLPDITTRSPPTRSDTFSPDSLEEEVKSFPSGGLQNRRSSLKKKHRKASIPCKEETRAPVSVDATAICVIHSEPGEEITPHESNDGIPEDTTHCEPSSESNEQRDEQTIKQVGNELQKSGLEVILEAAMEGLDSPRE